MYYLISMNENIEKYAAVSQQRLRFLCKHMTQKVDMIIILMVQFVEREKALIFEYAQILECCFSSLLERRYSTLDFQMISNLRGRFLILLKHT